MCILFFGRRCLYSSQLYCYRARQSIHCESEEEDGDAVRMNNLDKRLAPDSK